MKVIGNMRIRGAIGNRSAVGNFQPTAFSRTGEKSATQMLKFERISSPHVFVSETKLTEGSYSKKHDEFRSEMSERAKKNLHYPDTERIAPYEHLPLPTRLHRNPKMLEKVEGRFHCKACGHRYHSNDVWVTRSSRQCVQSTECPMCYKPNKPYYLHQPDPNIFTRKEIPRAVKTRRGSWARVSPSLFRKIG